MHKEKNHSEEEKKETLKGSDSSVSQDEETVTATVDAGSDETTSGTGKTKRVMSVKTATVIALVVIVLALLYVGRGLFVAALVDGSPVSRLSVVSELEKTSGKQMLDALVTKKLIANAAQEGGVRVESAEIDAEIATLEGQVTAAGSGTLLELLAQQGMTLDGLRGQIMIQKQLEKLLGEKVTVTDAEVEEYITSNKLAIPAAQLDAARAEIKQQMQQQKMSTEGQKLVAELRAKAKLKYFVQY